MLKLIRIKALIATSLLTMASVFKSNKNGQLRCRVKGRDLSGGEYKYTIEVSVCPAITSQIKVC